MGQYTSATASPVLKEEFDKRVVPAILQRKKTFSWMLKTAEKVDASMRGYYFAVKVRRNQGYGSNTLTQEGGLLPVAGTPKYQKVRADYQSHFLGGELSGDVMDAPDDTALLALSKDAMADAEESFTSFQDYYIFGNGSGSLGVTSTAFVAATVTFALSATRPLGSTKFVPSQRIQFINPSGGAQRTGGGVTVSTVISVDPATDIVTFDAVPTDVAVNDIAVIENTYNREMYGFDYYLNDANTTYLKDDTGAAITRSTNPWTKANVYDAASAALAPDFLDFAAAQTSNAMGDGELEFDMVMLSHIAQKKRYMALGYALTRNVNASGNKKLDLGFGQVSHNGQEWKTSPNCQPDRVLGLDPTTWVMPMVKMPQMYKWGSTGSALAQKPYTDRYYDAVQFYVYARFQLVCNAPFRNYLVKNLAFDASVVRQYLFA